VGVLLIEGTGQEEGKVDDMDHIRRIDECGNTEGHPSNTLLAGEMTKDQEAPRGCVPYHDPSNSPIYGSSSTNSSKVVKEKKLEHVSKRVIKK